MRKQIISMISSLRSVFSPSAKVVALKLEPRHRKIKNSHVYGRAYHRIITKFGKGRRP